VRLSPRLPTTSRSGQLGGLAAGYVVTKVAGVLGQHWWGRIVVAAAERRIRDSATKEAEQRITGTPELTAAERAKLTPEEQAVVDHGKEA